MGLVRVAVLLTLAACLPGGEGWECERRAGSIAVFSTKQDSGGDDCNAGLVCQSMSGYSSRSGQTSKAICVKYGTEEVSTTYNWMHVILSWAGIAIAAVALLVAVVKRLRRRRG